MNQKYAPTILFASLVIVMAGFGIALPLMAFFVTHFNASGSAMGITMASYSIMQFLFAPLWGKLSDRVGRKPILLIGILGYTIAFALQAFSQTLWMFIASRSLAGILSSATLPTAMAYMADITSKENRSKGVGLMGAAMGIGMIIGPMLGGLLSGTHLHLPGVFDALQQFTTDPETGRQINLSVPFLLSSLLALIAMPFIHLLLPESLSAEQRADNHRHHQQTASSSRAQQLLAALKSPLGFLLSMTFLLSFALANLESILALYGKQRFSMGPTDIGYIMGGMGILSVIEQGMLIGPLTRKFGEIKLLLGGLLISMAGLTGVALATGKWGLIAFSLLFSAGNVLLQPSVTSLISQRSKTTEQGTVMGYNNSFQSLGRAVGPLWAGVAFDIYPTASFWSGAVLQLMAWLIGLRALGRETPAGAITNQAVNAEDTN